MKKLELRKIDLSDYGFGEVISSVSKEEIDCILSLQGDLFEDFELVLRDFSYRGKGSFKNFLRLPPQEAITPIVESVWKNFCTGTYWFFGSILMDLENKKPNYRVVFDEDDALQFLAILVTLLDPQSQPVVLYLVEKLV